MTTEDDRAGVVAANDAFYGAVERGDLDALREVWVQAPTAVCVHPGAAPIHGTAQVLRSWALVMASTDYVQFFLTDVSVSVEGDVAALTCRENILTAGDRPGAGEPAGFHGGLAEALNVFVRTGDPATPWRLWVHQASPVVSEVP